MKSRFVSLAALMFPCLVAGVSLGALPETYTAVEYVKSTHQQYVDSEYVPNAKTKIVAEFSVDDYNEGSSYKGAYVFGCYGANNSGRCIFRYGQPLFVGWGSSYDNANIKSYPLDAVKHIIVLDKGAFSIDGGDACYSKSWSGTSVNLGLFGSNPNNGTLNSGLYSAIKLYSLVISEDGVEKCHFVPATDGSGVAGLYDTERETFYTSKTGTPLQAPPPAGVPSLSGFQVVGSYADGAQAKVSVSSEDILNTTVDCFMGPDPETWTVLEHWSHVQKDATYTATRSPVAYGDTYFAAFRVTYRHEGQTCELWTETNSVQITGKVDWKGTTGAAWNVASNWDPQFVPNSGLSASFSGNRLVTAGAEELTARAIYVQDNTTALSFDPGTKLDFTYLHIGNTSSAKLAVTNGVLTSSQGIDFPKPNGALVLYGAKATFDGLLNLDHNAIQVVLRTNALLSVKGVTGVVGEGSIRVRDTSQLCATGDEGIVLMNGQTLTVDGGTVTNDGVLYVGSLNMVGSGSDKTPANLQILNGGTWIQRHGSIHLAQCRSANICVADGSLFDATDYGVYFPNTQDALASASAADSLFVVTNSTVKCKSMNIGYHPLRRKAYTLRLVGEEARLNAEADIRLGAGWGAAPDNLRNGGSSLLDVNGSTVVAGGSLILGTSSEGTATDTLKVSGASAKVRVAAVSCTTNAVLRFVVPANGFANPVLQATGLVKLAASSPTPIEIDATACRSCDWQTLIRGAEIRNLDLDQVNVAVAEDRHFALRLVNEGDMVTELQFRLKSKGLVVVFR